jgi:hypothetical protein
MFIWPNRLNTLISLWTYSAGRKVSGPLPSVQLGVKQKSPLYLIWLSFILLFHFLWRNKYCYVETEYSNGEPSPPDYERAWPTNARIVVVLIADSPGKAAQWFGESIPESWGVLWLVIRLLSMRAEISPSLSACRISPHHYPYFSYSASEDCRF